MRPLFLYLEPEQGEVTLSTKRLKAIEMALKPEDKRGVVKNFERGTMEKLSLGYEGVIKA